MNNLSPNNSTIYITGAGPGDPGLLTLKAKEIISISDVIVYDNLVSKEILDLALDINPNIKFIYAGKVGYKKERSINQQEINNLLLKLSKEYKTICRLKGGDPYIFGRGAEEAIFLKENLVNFEIIPGVSSITAVPAYAGIPLTHRDCTSSFTVITAHENPGNPDSTIQWESFDAIKNTLVILMGVKNLPQIINKLINLGRSPYTPLAIIYSGTTNNQKTIKTNLALALKNIDKYTIQAPSIIVIGDVVNYRDILNWYETKILFKKKILITRSKEQASSFASKLIKQGASPIHCPIVSYELIEKESFNKTIINNLSNFDWIFFTSQNAVKYFFEILNRNYYDARALSKTQIAAVGYKTKLELEKYNLRADFIPKRFSFEDLIHELGELKDLQDQKILYPTQEIRHEIPQLNIAPWIIYKANFIDHFNEWSINQLKDGIDIITLFSSDTATHFYNLIKKHELDTYIQNALIATIGHETAKTVKALFGKTDITAEPFTEDGLIESIEKYFSLQKIPLLEEINP